MKKRTALFAALCLALPLFLSPLEAREKGLDARIDIDVVKAGDVFELFAELAGMKLELDPAVRTGPLTLRLENVRLAVALNTACDSLGCTWVVSPGSPSRLRVYPGNPQPAIRRPAPATLDTRIDIHALDTEGVQVIESVARLLSAEARFAPRLAGKVDVDFKKAAVRDILDEVCLQIGCGWKLKEGRTLEVSARR